MASRISLLRLLQQPTHRRQIRVIQTDVVTVVPAVTVTIVPVATTRSNFN